MALNRNRKRRIIIEGYFEGGVQQDTEVAIERSILDYASTSYPTYTTTRFKVEGFDPDVYVIEEIDIDAVRKRVKPNLSTMTPLNPDAYLLLRRLEEAEAQIARMADVAKRSTEYNGALLQWVSCQLLKKRYDGYGPVEIRNAYDNYMNPLEPEDYR